MKEIYFWIDNLRNRQVSYESLINELNNASSTRVFIKNKDPYLIFFNLLLNMLNSTECVLLDSDFSEIELRNLGIDPVDVEARTPTSINLKLKSIEELIKSIENAGEKWILEIYTSGTTGKPKSIKQPFASLIRGLKKREQSSLHTWAFAYNPSHFAGLQVFFQALLNCDKMVYIFETPPETIEGELKKHQITHISCTPTFLKQFIYYITSPIESIIQATFGGERFDRRLLEKINHVFPLAKIRNIYASTEAGSLFASEGESFKISERLKPYVRIGVNGELQIHKSLLGKSEEIELVDDWYNTGDLIEMTNNNNFIIVNRTTDMINVGGYKVNPIEVEEVIKSVNGVKDALILGRANSVTGNIIVAKIILQQKFDQSEVKNDIKLYTRQNLQSWKIPRIVKFVEKFERSRTGKLIRK